MYYKESFYLFSSYLYILQLLEVLNFSLDDHELDGVFFNDDDQNGVKYLK